jgi:hypothetical protein
LSPRIVIFSPAVSGDGLQVGVVERERGGVVAVTGEGGHAGEHSHEAVHEGLVALHADEGDVGGDDRDVFGANGAACSRLALLGGAWSELKARQPGMMLLISLAAND